MKKSEPLAAKIAIFHMDNSEIASLYSRESFNLLGVPLNNDKQSFLEIGNMLIINDKKYVIKEINFKMESYFWKAIEESYGVNMYSMDANAQGFDQNCQIGIFVEETES